jgi:hypothetical protein
MVNWSVKVQQKDIQRVVYGHKIKKRWGNGERVKWGKGEVVKG